SAFFGAASQPAFGRTKMRPRLDWTAVAILLSATAAAAWEPPKAKDFFAMSKHQDKRVPKAVAVYEPYAKADWGANWKQALYSAPVSLHASLQPGAPYSDPWWGANWKQALYSAPVSLHASLQPGAPYSDPWWGANWKQALYSAPVSLHASLQPGAPYSDPW